jgi:hypothetical protein
MTKPAPQWLSSRGGTLRQGIDGRTWFVLIDGEPLYALVPKPVAGQYGCDIKQTVNGKPLDFAETFAQPDGALSGGLEALRKALGW